jgi:hypothetical protein
VSKQLPSKLDFRDFAAVARKPAADGPKCPGCGVVLEEHRYHAAGGAECQIKVFLDANPGWVELTRKAEGIRPQLRRLQIEAHRVGARWCVPLWVQLVARLITDADTREGVLAALQGDEGMRARLATSYRIGGQGAALAILADMIERKGTTT